MAKKILIISEKKLDTDFLSGIELRVLQMTDYFKGLELQVDIMAPPKKLTNIWKYDFIYLMQTSSNKSLAYRLSYLPLRPKIIVDLYTPLLLEKQTYSGEKYAEVAERIRKVVSLGNFYICATPRQKKYYNLKNLAVVPFIPQEPSIPKQKIDKKNFTLVWLGAFYPWFSPENLIKAVNLIKDKELKLIIIGGKNPKTNTFDTNFENIIKLANNKKITFYPWLKYKEMFKILAQANAGVCLTSNSAEDRLAIRSRMLSLLQAGLPLIVNGNDELSEIIIDNKLGIKLEKNDPVGVVQAINKIKKMTFSTNIWSIVKNKMLKWKDDEKLQKFLN